MQRDAEGKILTEEYLDQGAYDTANFKLRINVVTIIRETIGIINEGCSNLVVSIWITIINKLSEPARYFINLLTK